MPNQLAKTIEEPYDTLKITEANPVASSAISLFHHFFSVANTRGREMAMRPSTVMRAVSSWRQSAAQRSLAMQGTFANILNILHAAHICTFQYMLYNCYITLWCFMMLYVNVYSMEVGKQTGRWFEALRLTRLILLCGAAKLLALWSAPPALPMCRPHESNHEIAWILTNAQLSRRQLPPAVPLEGVVPPNALHGAAIMLHLAGTTLKWFSPLSGLQNPKRNISNFFMQSLDSRQVQSWG